jgi:hypothetical protein
MDQNQILKYLQIEELQLNKLNHSYRKLAILNGVER